MKLPKFRLSLILSLILIIGLIPFTASAASASVTMNTVSSIYPGDIVTISGTSTLSEVNVKVVRPSNSVVFFDIVKVNAADGKFSTSFTLGSSEATGTYKIVAGQGNEVATQDLVVAAKAVGGFGGGGGGGPSSVTSTNGKITLPAGGTGVVSLEDKVTVSIPANATSKELKLTIEKLLKGENLLTIQQVLLSSIFEILKNFPENFSKPVTLTFAFDSASLSGNQKPSVFYYDETKKEWVEVGGKVNGNQISVEVDHFTKFAVFAVGQADTNTKFSDISGHWAEANIKQAVSSGIVKGYSDGTFKPGKTVTRAEFAVMLMNALKPQLEGAELTFSDSAKIGAWARKAVAQAVQAGIIKGDKDGKFRPNAEITRAEMAVMLANVAGQSSQSNAATGFADDKDIPAWAKASVAYVKQARIMQGKGDNEFSPQDQATRAEAVTVLLKMPAQPSK